MEQVDNNMSDQKKSDWMIPWYFVAFFVVLALLDGVFVYVATSTHTGVVTEGAYQKGLDYNDTIAAAETQASLGWNGAIELENNQLAATVTDANGHYIVGARVEARFFRPTQDGDDFEVRLNDVSNGRYVSSKLSVKPGQWEVRIFVSWKQKTFQTAQRIVVPQQ